MVKRSFETELTSLCGDGHRDGCKGADEGVEVSFGFGFGISVEDDFEVKAKGR
jgi:hypothetical protein